MQYDTFLGQVQQRARLGSGGDAVAAVRATLETLALYLTPADRRKLAAQLPREVGLYLTRSSASDAFPLRSRRAFFARVASVEPASLSEGAYHARIVLSVITDAVSAGEQAHLAAQLPAPLVQLLTSEVKAERQQHITADGAKEPVHAAELAGLNPYVAPL